MFFFLNEHEKLQFSDEFSVFFVYVRFCVTNALRIYFCSFCIYCSFSFLLYSNFEDCSFFVSVVFKFLNTALFPFMLY